MLTEQELWDKFCDFRIDECLGLWSDATIELPFGKLCLFSPHADASLLYRADIRHSPFNEIVQQVESFTQLLGRTGGFKFSSAWRGDIESFKGFISSSGYTKYCEDRWLVKDQFDNVDAFQESNYSVEETNDSDAVKEVFCKSFSGSDGFGQLIKNKMDHSLGPVQCRFMLARNANHQPIACAGYSFEMNLVVFTA